MSVAMVTGMEGAGEGLSVRRMEIVMWSEGVAG